MNWTSGYVAEIDYTYGYYRELQPGLIDYALLFASQKPIRADTSSEPMQYLELGYGQGLSLNIHAAASPGRYWGTDFNPSQAAGATEMARSSGSNLTLLDASFEELATSDDLPAFDVIALHGIWSWISDSNRGHIVEIIRRHLRPGGIVYISYNCTPGWSAAMPLRHLLSLHAELAEGDAKGIVGKIDGALAFAQQVVDSGAQFFRANAAVAERLKKIAEQNRNYLAHEYFNADWHPMPFSDLAA
jgi:SAM-dependent methyltransferase